MPINTQYATEIHEQYGYLATWLPTSHIELGDLGVLREGVFERTGKLSDFGIAFKTEMHADAGDIEYASADAVSQQVKGGGNAPVTAAVGGSVDVSVGISFKRANAILLQASRCTSTAIANISALSDAVLSRYAEGTWPADCVVITDLMSAETLTVLISSGANAEIDISVKGDVGANGPKLASVNASYTVNSASSIGTRIIGQKGAAPLFKARGIKRTFLDFGPATFREKTGAPVQLGTISIRDLVVNVEPPPIRGG